MDKKVTIGIDARFYGPAGKGLGRYTQKLIEYLERLDGESQRQYIIFLRKNNFNEYHPGKSNFRKVLADYPWYSVSEQVGFPLFLRKFNLDLMHFGHFNVPILYHGRFIVTIHDLILFHYPTIRNTTLNKYYYYFKLYAYRKVIMSAVLRAEKVIAVSEFTRQDIIKNLSIDGQKVVTTLEGCDIPRISREGGTHEEIMKKYDIMKPYLLYVGNAYPHKNLDRLCKAFAVIKDAHPDLQLVLVGGKDYFYNRLGIELTQRQRDGIVITGFVSEEELNAIYQQALLYVFPSLYEGFGLPPLEALAHGVPVISSSRTSMPEVLGEAVVYFDPENIDSMVEAIERVIGSDKIRQEIVKKGTERLRRFQWGEMTKKTLELYIDQTR